jgi:hypothetical protein
MGDHGMIVEMHQAALTSDPLHSFFYGFLRRHEINHTRSHREIRDSAHPNKISNQGENSAPASHAKRTAQRYASLMETKRRTPQEKFILYFEAAKRSLLACQTLLDRLEQELAVIEPHLAPTGEVNELIVPALLSAVSFIDFAHRFGELMAAMPLVPTKLPELRGLRTALQPVEQIRNHLQHLRGELATNDPVDYPLLGSIAWAQGRQSFAVAMGQSTQSTFASMVYDTVNDRWVARLRYSVGNTVVDFDPVLEEMKKAYAWLVERVKFSDLELSKLTWGRTVGFSCTLELSMKNLPPPEK